MWPLLIEWPLLPLSAKRQRRLIPISSWHCSLLHSVLTACASESPDLQVVGLTQRGQSICSFLKTALLYQYLQFLNSFHI
jgi:hypothetical protein